MVTAMALLGSLGMTLPMVFILFGVLVFSAATVILALLADY